MDSHARAATEMLSEVQFSPYALFNRDHWATLRASTPLTLSEDDLAELRGINEEVSMEEVKDIYLPLSRLLNLYISATQGLHEVTDVFLGTPSAKVPFVIGVAGSVAVGKSTTARILQALLSRWPDHPRVDLVTTDGFLLPNTILEQRGLMNRKGFPESYDLKRLVSFVRDVKSGVARVEAPLYSHLIYDVLLDKVKVIEQPDILIIEGLNVLQRGENNPEDGSRVFVSDFFDFSIFVDAPEADLMDWFIARFERLRETAFHDEASFFRHFVSMSDEEAFTFATDVWNSINGLNLRDNILPTRERAHLILEKGRHHRVERVRLRKL